MKKWFSLSVFLFSLAAFVPSSLYAHPKINEVYSSSSEDWIEITLSRESTSPLTLENYRIRDTSKTNKIDLSGSISPDGFAVFDFGNKLNNTGDTVKLIFTTNGQEEVVDEVSYGKKDQCNPEGNQTVGRVPDQATFVIFNAPTKGQKNSAGSTPCVEIVDEVEEPKEEVITPRPSSTTNAITRLTEKPRPTANEEPLVDGAQTEATKLSPTSISEQHPEVLVKGDTQVPSSPLGTFFIGLGILFLVLGISSLVFELRKRYNKRYATYDS